MNLNQLKYIVEVAKSGSVTKAAENLFISQPNISRAIAELEKSLGVQLFCRDSKRMTLTQSGEIFVSYAKDILSKLDSLEHTFKFESSRSIIFSVTAPRSNYIACAFTEFVKKIPQSLSADLHLKETDPEQVLNNVLNHDYKLGIYRFLADFGEQSMDTLSEKKLEYRPVSEFRCKIIMSKTNVMSNKKRLNPTDLCSLTELVSADAPLPATVKTSEYVGAERRIFLADRLNRIRFLAELPDAFMLGAPLPNYLCEQYNLVQREYTGDEQLYRDVLVYKKDYKLSTFDKMFIDELTKMSREICL